jgi:DNA-binding transcriptional LysR family regulator
MITNPNLSLKALRAFAFVVENRSISAAARKMNIATSAVAASVNQVEAEVGAKLLVRSRAHGVSPTEQAIALATQFRNLLEEYSQILDQGRSWASELSGTLRIGYYAPIAPAFLPELLVPIMQSSPKLSFQCQNITMIVHRLLCLLENWI